LVWRNRKKISQIIKDFFDLPFFLLFILWVSPNNLVIPGNDEREVGLDQRGGYDTANKNMFSDLSAKYMDAIGQPKQFKIW
jgi:hypothetical protein